MKNRYFPIRILLVFASFLLTVLLYIDRACISAAKEEISSDLNFDLTDFGWVMAMFTLGYALFQTPSGKWADKRGPRGVIASIVTLWSLLTALTGAAWNYVSMLVIRFLFGAGEAGAFPSLAKVVYNWVPVKERGIVQGFNFSGVGNIIHVTEHLSYHTGQIALWTKILKNKDLAFYGGVNLNAKNE